MFSALCDPTVAYYLFSFECPVQTKQSGDRKEERNTDDINAIEWMGLGFIGSQKKRDIMSLAWMKA